MATAHYQSLNSRHVSLDHAISDELQRPKPDTIHLAQLKKEKLRLKEEMLRSQMH